MTTVGVIFSVVHTDISSVCVHVVSHLIAPSAVGKMA